MKTPIAILILILTFICGTAGERTDVARYVNPLIGTDFTGNTYPGAQVSFGMVQLSPDNGLSGWDRIAGYFYPDSTIAGFSHTHLSGTGAGDLYDISFMPVTLPWREEDSSLGIHSRFSHDSERAEAGYYRVTLADYGIGVELTATERCGLQRYTFPKAQSAVILNLHKAMNWDRTVDSRIEVVDSVTVEGYRFSDGWARNQKVYFRTRFSHPFDSVRVDTTALKDGGKACVAYFYFDTVEGSSSRWRRLCRVWIRRARGEIWRRRLSRLISMPAGSGRGSRGTRSCRVSWWIPTMTTC